jgi:hypothetical protein
LLPKIRTEFGSEIDLKVMSTIKIIQKIEKSIPNRISYCNSVWEIATDSVDITKWIEEIVVMIKTTSVRDIAW